MKKFVFLWILALCLLSDTGRAQYAQRYYNLNVLAPNPMRHEQFAGGIKTVANYANNNMASYYNVGVGTSYGTTTAGQQNDRMRFTRLNVNTNAGQIYGYEFANSSSPALIHHSSATSVAEYRNTTGTGGYVACGQVRSNPNTGSLVPWTGDAMYCRINSSANVTWSYRLNMQGNDIATCVRPYTTTPNEYIMCGYTSSTTTAGTVQTDAWVARFLVNGTMTWLYRYRISGSDCKALSLVNDQFGNIYVVGSYQNFAGTTGVDGLFFSLDANGNLLCQNSYHLSSDDQFQSIKYTSNGLLLVGGFTDVSNGVYAMWYNRFDVCFLNTSTVLLDLVPGALANTKCYDLQWRTNTANQIESFLIGPTQNSAGNVTHIYKVDFAGNGIDHWYFAPLGTQPQDDKAFAIDIADNTALNTGLIAFSNTDHSNTPGITDSYAFKAYFNGATCTNYCPTNPPATNILTPVKLPLQMTRLTPYNRVTLVATRYNYLQGTICNQASLACGSNAKGEVDDISIKDPSGDQNISISPNPASSFINVRNLADTSDPLLYSIYNMAGSKLSEGILPENDDILDISSLSTGIYIINFSNKDISVTRKLIVE